LREPRWWFDVANILLGVNQALCWSMIIVMKVDVVGPRQRGLALGLNAFASYLKQIRGVDKSIFIDI
jgi:predicted MFS family arabinose efflux permease